MTRRPATRFAGVLGWPLEASLSPVIHNAAFRKLGLDWIYLAWPVPPELLAEAVGGLRALGAMGANVTMPHKAGVVALLDELSGDARSLGAVNTIQSLGDRLIGHNTDIDGFKELLVADAGVDLNKKSALVLGAGGAARAVVRGLADLGAAQVMVAARSSDAAEEVASLAGPAAAPPVTWARASKHASEADVVVNTTPVGTTLGGRGGENDPVPEASWHKGQVVVDLIYDPPATPMVKRARTAGADAWGGIGMLVHQAAASFRIWTGQEPPIETMSAAAIHALGHRPQNN